MLVTGYAGKMKKDRSDFTFTLEGTIFPTALDQMLYMTAPSMRDAIWNEKKELRSFLKLALEPDIKDSVSLHNQETGELVTEMSEVQWKSFEVVPGAHNSVNFVLKGLAILNNEQVLALERCVRERLELDAKWSETQARLPLPKGGEK